jgi:hypothetical protein
VTDGSGHLRRQYLSTASGLLVGGTAYFVTLLNYGTDISRTALAGGIFSGFFDAQARALLDGHLDVPSGALGIEGFVHDGKTYTYFPPWPAVLRLPVLMTTHEFDYQLTLLSMALAWVVLAVMVVKLVWFLVPRITGTDEISATTAVLAGLFIAGATGGTFLTYDASLPWVYHEVYTWAVAAAVGGLYWMTRTLVEPSTHAIWWLLVLNLVAVGSRATEGWALCLGTVGVAVYFLVRRRGPERRLWWRILLAGLVPLAVSITVNMLKFDAIYMFPLQDQVWTQVNEQRRIALEKNDGSLTGLQFFTTSFMAYLRFDGIRFVDYFPWVTLPAHAAPSYHGAYPDQSYRTGSVTAFMPLFLALTVVSVVASFRPHASRVLALLRIPLVSAVLITGAVMTYGYYSTRYASDFVPALVLGGAVGTALLCRLLAQRPRVRLPAMVAVATLTMFSVVAQLAIAIPSAAYLHRGEPLARYVEWQHRWSGDAQVRLIGTVDGLPTGGDTDDLVIRGDCDSLYIHTGDTYEPWLPVIERDKVLVLTPTGPLRPGTARLLTVDGLRTGYVDLQVDSRQRVRLTVSNGEDRVVGQYEDAPTGGVRIGVRNRIDFGFYEVAVTPGGVAGYIPSVYFDEDWDSLPALLNVEPDEESLEAMGLQVSEQAGLPNPLCHELAAAAGLDLS